MSLRCFLGFHGGLWVEWSHSEGEGRDRVDSWGRYHRCPRCGEIQGVAPPEEAT